MRSKWANNDGRSNRSRRARTRRCSRTPFWSVLALSTASCLQYAQCFSSVIWLVSGLSITPSAWQKYCYLQIEWVALIFPMAWRNQRGTKGNVYLALCHDWNEQHLNWSSLHMLGLGLLSGSIHNIPDYLTFNLNLSFVSPFFYVQCVPCQASILSDYHNRYL